MGSLILDILILALPILSAAVIFNMTRFDFSERKTPLTAQNYTAALAGDAIMAISFQINLCLAAGLILAGSITLWFTETLWVFVLALSANSLTAIAWTFAFVRGGFPSKPNPQTQAEPARLLPVRSGPRPETG